MREASFISAVTARKRLSLSSQSRLTDSERIRHEGMSHEFRRSRWLLTITAMFERGLYF